MANTYKVLGQVVPSAATASTVYTVPSSTQAVISTISVCNTNTTTAIVRVAFRPAGETLATKHYVIYDVTLDPKETITMSIGATLATTDVVTVYSSVANVSFNVFGTEVA